MLFKKPVSLILLIVAVCLTFASWFIFVAPLFSIIGVYAGIVYEYKEGESKLLNRIGMFGSLSHVLIYIGTLCYLVMDLE